MTTASSGKQLLHVLECMLNKRYIDGKECTREQMLSWLPEQTERQLQQFVQTIEEAIAEGLLVRRETPRAVLYCIAGGKEIDVCRLVFSDDNTE